MSASEYLSDTPESVRDGPPFSNVNALLVALHPLLEVHAGPRIAWQPPTPSLAYTRILDTVAALCAYHPLCDRAAAALEGTPTRITLYISPSPQPRCVVKAGAPSPMACACMCQHCVGDVDQRFKVDVEAWVGCVWSMSRTRSESNHTAGPGGTAEDPNTLLVSAVYRSCYPTFRAQVRDGILALETLERWLQDRPHSPPLSPSLDIPMESCEGWAPDDGIEWADDTKNVGSRLPCSHSDGVARLCFNLRMLLESCNAKDGTEMEDPNDLLRAHIVGRAIGEQMGEPGFRAFVGCIDAPAVLAIDSICELSRLVNNLIVLAQSYSIRSALSTPWRVAWVDPNLAPDGDHLMPFEAILDSDMLADWVESTDDSQGSDLGLLLDGPPPNVSTWLWSEVTRRIGREAPTGLTREEYTRANGKHAARFMPTPCPHAQMDNSSTPPTSVHCEAALLAHLYNNHVPAHPYISVSRAHNPPSPGSSSGARSDTPGCYGCLALARTLDIVCGEGFVLRGSPDPHARARVILPWTCPPLAPSDPFPSSPPPSNSSYLNDPDAPDTPTRRLSESADTFALTVERLMEDVLLRDLQRLLVQEAEGAIVREEVAMICQVEWAAGVDGGGGRIGVSRERGTHGLSSRPRESWSPVVVSS